MQRTQLKECKICGALENVCFHYGVRSCRACGAFFRRYLENEKECKYKCKCIEKNENDLNNISANISKCKRCRLQKCLLAGMHKLGKSSLFFIDAIKVGYLRQDICREQQNEEMVATQVIPQVVDISFQDRKEIDSFLLIVDAKKRIMHSFFDLNDIFLQGPILFKEIILSGFNIFSQIDNFSPNPSPISTDELINWESEIKMKGLFNNRYQKYFLVDRLICYAIARTMNVFEKLSMADQIAHLRHISYAFTSFTSSYLAWELGFETWTRKDCVMPALATIKNEEYQNDFKFIKLSDRQFTKSVVPFKQTALTDDEYALLIAIIFTQPEII
ncbi:hypothetical protein Mgra_00008648 [Meloidogyne graminicola]|uniref:Nuclear receptor domain-containing protein n=1 Tax=Meloidogyne graminicola TaxID=189291 RepID=A0A8S9ZF79_9BILA|nr:hypothetical protein Mgra_00008648 [Meloidogyne graminicola]